MLSNKEKSILELLLQNKDQMITSREVGNILNLSDRTIRNYMKRLQELLLKNGAEIIARPSQGYKLIINHELEFNIFLQKNINKSIMKNEIYLSDSKDRQYYIFNKLFFEDSSMLFDDLCEQLYVCRSTLSSDFAEIRKFLKPYNISVVSKAKKGVYIQGDEQNKRHFIIDYFFRDSFSIFINKYVDNTLFLNNISFEEITIIILEECRESNLRLSDYIIQNLVLHIVLAIKRIKDGFNLPSIEIDESIEEKKEFLVAQSILNRITNSNKINFPKEEAYYIALHLKAKSISKNISGNHQKNNIYNELINILESIENDTGYAIKNDKQLINELIEHFEPLLMRLKHGVVVENPLLNEIKEKYSEILHITKHYLSSMSILKDFVISDNEWAYICLHFMVAIERFKNSKKLNVLVICATGYGSGQLLSVSLQREFGHHINIVDVIGYYEINDKALQGIDLIISSIDLYALVFTVPVIKVSVFLNDGEIKEIKDFIDEKIAYIHKVNKNNSLEVTLKKEQLINKIFKEDCFHIINGQVFKEDLINKLVLSLQKYEDPNYSKIMIKQIAQREKMSSVIFSDRIAIPHPAKSVGESAHVAVAVIEKGLYWNEEFPSIKFVFLLSPSSVENTNLKCITRAIVSLTEDKDIQAKLLESSNFNEFMEVLKELI